MSYDIDLRCPKTESSAASRQEMTRKAIAALRGVNPKLELFESQCGFEMTDVETGVQIYLPHESDGAITIPYWQGNSALQVLGTVSQYMRVLAEEVGLSAHDRQTGQEVNAESGYALSSHTHAYGVNVLRQVTRKPWWRFW